MRGFWPVIADTVATGVPLVAALDQVHLQARRLGRAARELEEKSLDP